MLMNVMYVVKIGLNVQQICLQVIFNNFVNVNIIGFKCDCVNFEIFLYQVFCFGGDQILDVINLILVFVVGIGVCVVSIDKLFSQGVLLDIGNVFDVVVNGQGFFQVLFLDGCIGYICDGGMLMN